MSNYGEQLKHPKWQKRRLEILQRDGWKCVSCENGDEELHVHHTSYMDESPWEYPDDCLVSLCHICHRVHHARCPTCNTKYQTTWPCCLVCGMMACKDPKTGFSVMMRPAKDYMLDSISEAFKKMEQRAKVSP